MAKDEKEEIDLSQYKHLQALKRHINLVIDAAQLLGERLIEQGEVDLGINLIKNSFLHDNSKFKGIEWNYLNRDTEDGEKLKLAHLQHVSTNEHHPEYWGNINDMPEVYLAELTCDWYSRGQEQGTDLREWIKTEATERFDFSPQGKAYKLIKKFVDLLLDEPFTKLK